LAKKGLVDFARRRQTADILMTIFFFRQQPYAMEGLQLDRAYFKDLKSLSARELDQLSEEREPK
jgi:hypothetical protein